MITFDMFESSVAKKPFDEGRFKKESKKQRKEILSEGKKASQKNERKKTMKK